MGAGRVACAALVAGLLVATLGAVRLLGAPRATPTKDELPKPAPALRGSAAAAMASARAPAALLGVVLARSSAEVAPRAEGKLVAVHVRLGDHVIAGQPIAAVDASALPFDLRIAQAQLREAEAQRERASAELTLADERLRRRQALSADALASGEDLATADAQRRIAASELDKASAQRAERGAEVERLRKQREDLVLRAPFAGEVAARYLDPGASVSPLTPILRLLSANDAFVRFALPEADAAGLERGDAVRVWVPDQRSDLTGTIEKIAPEIDAAARLVFVEARLDLAADQAAPRSGTIVRVAIERKPGSP